MTRRDKTLFVMGAGTLRYGEIVGVLDAAKGAGVDRVGIVTERMQGKADAVRSVRARAPMPGRARGANFAAARAYFAATATGSSHGRPVRPKWP